MVAMAVISLEAAELRVGRAQIRITLPVGAPLAGYYHERGSEKVHDAFLPVRSERGRSESAD
jgi:hypothetical protein